MKRPPTILLPDAAAPTGRRRTLSEEERALWEAVARQAKPLKKARVAKPKASSRNPETHVSAEPSRTQFAPTSSPKPVKPAMPPLAPLARRERSQLSRGKREIDARLDLHGMTQAGAHQALAAFLRRAHRDRLTFVLVITGKGKVGADQERGVLRRQVPQWLSQPEFRGLVVGFEQAHVGHGGEGALYVRVRRPRI